MHWLEESSLDAGGQSWQRFGVREGDGRVSVPEPRRTALLLPTGEKETTEGGKQLMAPRGCLWPTSYYTSCGATPTQGRLCTRHLGQVMAHVSGWRCVWPGCQRLSSAGGGLCRFHVAIATGQTE